MWLVFSSSLFKQIWAVGFSWERAGVQYPVRLHFFFPCCYEYSLGLINPNNGDSLKAIAVFYLEGCCLMVERGGRIEDRTHAFPDRFL